MIELQQNRYLWIHFAGLAFVPLLLDICLAGLASAGPALPFGGQFWAIALFGITPALAMQWLRPFYIFSLPPSALKPAALSEDQRRCLQIFKSWQIKALAVLVAAFSLWLLKQIYVMLPQVSPLLTPKAGLIWGAIAFFAASTFMQISVSAGRALLISPTALKRVPAVEEGAIARDFLIFGIRLNKLLPETSNQSVVEEKVVEKTDESLQAARNSTTAAPEPTQTFVATSAEDTLAPTDEPIEVLDLPVNENSELEVVIPEKLPPKEDPST
ncbi:MAG: low-complexity tail membrane protein [Cyanobacteria bacterium P01_D01_bin.1]